MASPDNSSSRVNDNGPLLAWLLLLVVEARFGDAVVFRHGLCLRCERSWPKTATDCAKFI